MKIPNLDFYNTANPVLKTKTQEIIEQIHEDFNTEVDKLLKSAKIKLDETPNNPSLIEKANRLRGLGFSATKEVEISSEEEARINELKKENKEKDSIIRAIKYFSGKYPLYKFITEDSVKKICEKYNLVYSTVDRYIGAVPDKNLNDIENFNVSDSDCCAEEYTRYSSIYGSTDTNRIYSGFSEGREDKLRYSNIYTSVGVREVYRKCALEIAAPIKDFNLDASEVKDFKISDVVIPDPVVLQPVHFEGKKHYLIVTAWGLESEDNLVMNPINN